MAQERKTFDSATVVDQPPQPILNLDDPNLYINRELSWLEFNRRVLDEALDERNPLLERVKFLSIFSTNLDEFFMVRVAGLVEQRVAGMVRTGPDHMTPSQQLSAIRTTVNELSQQQRQCWNEDIRPQLRDNGIIVTPYSDLSAKDQRQLTEYFERQIYPVLTPQAVDAGHPFPHISSLSLNMLIVIEDDRGEHVARMKIPQVVPRFVRVPADQGAENSVNGDRRVHFVLVEEVIEANLHLLFPGKIVKQTYMFRITRDADIDIRHGATESLLKTVEEELESRLFGFVVRLTVEPAMPREWRQWLADRLNVTANETYVMERPLGFSDLIELYRVNRPEFKDPAFTPRIPNAFLESSNIFEILQRQEVLLYHPYDSFTPVVDLVRQASTDSDVVAIKQTLYRVGSQSPIVDALLEARDDETQVAVLVELKARFDEESNINWARALESNGVHVTYGVSGLKTHSKMMLVVRREGNQLHRYVHLGTGNYNPTTARIYTDLSFMTVDEDIAADVSDIFNQLTGYSDQIEFRKLLVAPANLRSKFTELIRRETEYGAEGRIIMKMNSLSDPRIIQEIYRASQAGVRIDLLTRGICCLRPGMPGVSDNIRVISIVGKFLEHARVYYFAHGSPDNDECVYVGSADLMPRNLDYRVEVVFPVEDPSMLAYLRDDLLLHQLDDNVHARELQPDGTYVRLQPGGGEEPVDSQALPGPTGPDAASRAVPWLLR